jgi:hypothetical protein
MVTLAHLCVGFPRARGCLHDKEGHSGHDSCARGCLQLLHDYHEALAAATNALYQVAQWAVKPVEDEGNFDKLVMMLPSVARALDMVGIEIDETAVKDL